MTREKWNTRGGEKMQTFGEKYNISGFKAARSESGEYRGSDYEYTVPETGELRQLFVPASSSLVQSLLNDLRKA
jgi:hypothetical protein